jgi:hypothetical protein
MSLLNEGIDIDYVIDTMLEFSTEKRYENLVKTDKYSLSEHVSFSCIIIEKLREVSISKEEYENYIEE